MVTRILFDPRRDLPDGTTTASTSVILEATPTGIREDGSVVILPTTLSFAVTTSADVVQLVSTTASWKWRLVVRDEITRAVLQQRTVLVPDQASIKYQDLPDVDPVSLGNTISAARNWDATFGQILELMAGIVAGELNDNAVASLIATPASATATALAASLSTTYVPLNTALATVTTAAAPAVGKIQPYDATAAALAPALPALSDLNVGAQVAVQKAAADASANVVTVTTAGADTFDSGATSLTLRIAGELRQLQVVTISGTKYWKVVAGNTPLAGLNQVLVARRTLLGLGNSIDNYTFDATAKRLVTQLASRVGDTGGAFTQIQGGVGGDTTTMMLARLPALLAANSPTYVTISPSINDRKVNGSGTTKAVTQANIAKMVALVRWAGAQPILRTEPPTNPVQMAISFPGVFSAQSEADSRRINDWVRTYAAANRIPLVDVAAAFATNDITANSVWQSGNQDGLHPLGATTGPAGSANGIDAIAITIVESLTGNPISVWGYPHQLPVQDWTDDFERADSSTIGNGWTQDAGTWAIAGGRVWSTGNYAKLARAVTGTDQVIFAQISGPAATQYMACICTRYTDATGGYYMALVQPSAARTGSVVKLYKVANNVPTQLGPSVTGPTPGSDVGGLGDTIQFELASIGNVHTVRVNGITLIQQTDTTYPTGSKVALVPLTGGALGYDFVTAYRPGP